jgi:hypothetical protein
MTEARRDCPDCTESLDRRLFLKAAAGTSVALAGLSSAPLVTGQEKEKPQARPAKPAEDLVREFFASMSAEQKSRLVLPWDHKEGNSPYFTRLRMFNSALPGRPNVGTLTAAQKDLVNKILAAISSGEDGLRQLTRNGTFDGSQTIDRCGAYIFGEPTEGKQWAYVFMGHHLTVRCDGNSEPNAAFGGPMYYGHSPDGYSQRNCFNYQTRAVVDVYDALNANQRTKATVTGSPGEHESSVQFRRDNHPGLAGSELTADQKRLVETVMRTILSPYRREDADEVMDIVRRNGGMDKIHLAFYQDRGSNDEKKWHFWRLEGPGFVWNYRVLPHVHTYVNIRGIA